MHAFESVHELVLNGDILALMLCIMTSESLMFSLLVVTRVRTALMFTLPLAVLALTATKLLLLKCTLTLVTLMPETFEFRTASV